MKQVVDTDKEAKIIWNPQGNYLNCRAARFMKAHGLSSWQGLIKKSVDDIEWFWQSCLEYVGMSWQKPYTKLLDTSEGFAQAKWFIDGKLNIVDNCLDFHLETGRKQGDRTAVGKDKTAIIWEGDSGEKRKLSYGELSELSGKVASLLTNLGVGKGDAVGIYMPMIPEVVAILFGAMKIGAVPVPVFSGFGAMPLASRMLDSKAKVLFCADAGKRRGKVIPIKPDADEAAKQCPDLKHIVIFDHCQSKPEFNSQRDLWWHEALANCEQSSTAELDAEHPSMYLYTSGTTGKPKGTVHTHAGALAQITKELGFAFDLQAEDIFFWVTDIGWMMGPWEMIGVTYWGATMVIFEGAPNYPQPDRLWQIVDEYKVSTLGISPTAIRVLKPQGDHFVEKRSLSSLRLLGSTGEPWDEDSYMWFFEKIGKSKLPIINISGGTEIVGCLLQPLPLMPLKPCSLGAQALAMDVDVFDEDGKPLRNSIGHLVCKKPAPSMTKGFLNDYQRYLDTYFSKFPEIWYHGDWAKIDHENSWFLFGRSDDTIKVAGKRIGPGEVESILIEHQDVAEAAVIGTPHEIKGEGLICFVVLGPNKEFSSQLESDLLALVAKRLGGPLKPEKIHCLQTLPKTRSGKIVRGAIRKMYLGEEVKDLSSVENPDSLRQIADLSK